MRTYTGKHIKDILRQRISALKPDARLPSEATLCKEFSVSRMTVNKIINCLANDGFLYRVKGSGTYVKAPLGNKQPIRFLLPCPEYFMYDCTYNMRLLLSAMLREASKSGLRIDGVPASKVNNPEKIDWGALDDFSAETTVVVPGMWYREIFPFLRDRGCRTIFCDLHWQVNQNYPDYFADWLKITLDSRQAMSSAVQFLAEQGHRKIGYVYHHYPQDSPLNAGYRDGLAAAGLEFDQKIVIYTGNVDHYFDCLANPATEFDALLLSQPDMARQTMLLLQQSGRKIPDELAILVFGDHERLQGFNPPLSAVSLPHSEAGKQIIETLAEKDFRPGNIKLTTTIFERESVTRGAGAKPNPELSVSGSESGFLF